MYVVLLNTWLLTISGNVDRKATGNRAISYISSIVFGDLGLSLASCFYDLVLLGCS